MMSDVMEELLLRLACETSLPCSNAAGRRAKEPFIAKPYTRAQARIEQQIGLLPRPPLRSSTPSKKRGRKADFDIFVDADTANIPPPPFLKKLKPNTRIPLSVRTDLANDTSYPCPRKLDTPFPFSRSDPLWANVENYDPRPYYMTPPPTPGDFTPTPSPSPSSPPRHSTRTVRPRRIVSANPLPPPKDHTLYRVLDLNDWQVTADEIKNAYKKAAVDHHPDRVAEDQRGAATHMMQIVNAAKEVLLDNKRRRVYHLSGKLPFTT